MRRLLALPLIVSVFLLGGAPASPTPFQETFEKVLNEDYSFMVRELKRLENQGVIDIGNYSNLSLEQRVAVLSYTYSTYEPVNSRLRKGGKAATEIQPYVDVLNSALDRLPRHNGIVLRTVDSLPPAVVVQHQVGETVTYAAYTSTSKVRSLSAAFNFTIRSRNGSDLEGYASNANEQEVLFKPGTRFRVTARAIKDGRYFFEMDEMP